MTVICLSNCPPKLRGDMTKWLIEINTGVFVGNINTRVREELWNRITENIRSGQATMVYKSGGEQRMDFQVHNTTWKPVDYDGLKLVLRPNLSTYSGEEQDVLLDGFSKAAKIRKVRRMQRAALIRAEMVSYIVLDLETTGLDHTTDKIIEIAALKICQGKVVDEFCYLIKLEQEIPQGIQLLTGITKDMIDEYGVPLQEVLEKLSVFISEEKLVCWNTAFDLPFLQLAYSHIGLTIPRNKTEDAMKLAKKKLKGLPNYQLTTAAQHYGIDTNSAHRALQDCYLTYAIYEKLNKNESSIG